MKAKRWVTVGGSLLLGATVLAGCSTTAVNQHPVASSGARDTAKVNLTLGMWSSSPAELALVKSQVSAFEKANPNMHVSIRVINGNYLQAIQPMLASHTAPDIFYVDSSVAPQLENAGVLMNLNSYIKADHVDVKDFSPNLLKAFSWKGAVYGLPKDFNTLAIESNTALLAKAGISKPPTTWAEFQKDAALLTAKKIAPLSFPVDVARFYPFVVDFGGNFYNAGINQATFPDPKNRAGLQYFMNLQSKHYFVTPQDQGASWPGDAFAQGKVAMAAEGAWIVPFMQTTAPKLKYTVSNFPSINGKDANMIFTVSYSMAKASAHPAAAAKLLFFMTGPQAEKMTAESGLAMPSRFSEQNVFLQKYPNYKAFVDGLKEAVPYQFGTLGQNFLDAINNATQAGILKKQSAQTVLANAAKTLSTQSQY